MVRNIECLDPVPVAYRFLLTLSRAMTSPTMDDSPTVLDVEAYRAPAKPARSRLGRWVKGLAVAGFVIIFGGGLGGMLGLALISQDLPELQSLADYRPPQATVVYGAQGQVVARFAKERRTVVPYQRIPKVMVNAVIAAEDSDFFQHQGLDYLGIVRCAVKNTVSRRKVCGASTITQQTVKTFFLTPERSYGRKIREMVLSKRLEDALSKEDILFLYLNQIFFGHGAYGVQEAAKVYFGKDVGELEIEEAALLAGLPQSPARLDPYKYPDRALKRRAYVLGRLKENGFIDEATHARLVEAPLELDWKSAEADVDSNNHYAAHVRTLLEQMVQPERVDAGGLHVYTGLDPAMQRVAERAVRSGLREVDKRQGWRGPLFKLAPDELRALSARLEERRSQVSPRRPPKKADAGPVIFNLARLEGLRPPQELDRLMEQARFPRFELEEIYGGLVVAVDDPGKSAVVDLGGVKVHLPLRTGLAWARKFDTSRLTKSPTAPSEVLAVGDVVLVKATAVRKVDGKAVDQEYIGVLEQNPLVEGALVAIDAQSREVRAMVGGYGIGAGTFNRAVQARRQAGSTFKPLVYAAAFESRSYTPVSKCLDAPRVYRDEWTGKPWKPENYGRTFDGEMTLRTALTLSKNICSVDLIDKVGVDPVLDVAKRAGIHSALPRNLTLALGSGDVTPLEMVNSYVTLAAGGTFAEPLFITKVVDPSEREAAKSVLFEARPEPRPALSPEVAYLVTSLMQSVVEDGTAKAVKVMERPVAGKTGTTNESRNAWFIGYTPDLVAGVWVGFDDNGTLGPRETGGRAAIPIWLSFMGSTVRGPAREFVAPSGIVFTTVDPKSGHLVSATAEGARTEPFIAGTEPTEVMEQTPRAESAIFEDYE